MSAGPEGVVISIKTPGRIKAGSDDFSELRGEAPALKTAVHLINEMTLRAGGFCHGAGGGGTAQLSPTKSNLDQAGAGSRGSRLRLGHETPEAYRPCGSVSLTLLQPRKAKLAATSSLHSRRRRWMLLLTYLQGRSAGSSTWTRRRATSAPRGRQARALPFRWFASCYPEVHCARALVPAVPLSGLPLHESRRKPHGEQPK